MKSKPSLPPGLDPNDAALAKMGTSSENASESNASYEGLSKAAKKNMKRKDKKRNQDSTNDSVNSIGHTLASTKLTEKETAPNVSASDNHSTTVNDVDAEEKRECLKRLRTLRKKFKQIIELQSQVDAGKIVPDKEQLEKLSKRKTIENEMKDLELIMNDDV